MTSQQKRKVRGRAYKFYDEVIFENLDWSKHDIATASFVAGAEYALKNKYDELKEDAEKKNEKPNIVQFLKDSGVYEMFFANLLNKKQGDSLSQYFLSYFFNDNAISGAFLWDDTPEGDTFWRELSEEWSKQF